MKTLGEISLSAIVKYQSMIFDDKIIVIIDRESVMHKTMRPCRLRKNDMRKGGVFTSDYRRKIFRRAFPEQVRGCC